MKQHIIVREYAALKIRKISNATSLNNLDEAHISQKDFDYLYDLSNIEVSEFESKKKIFQLVSRTTLKVQNFVGVIQTPYGTVLEILPKIANLNDANELKSKLFEMILIAHNIKYRQVDLASLKSYKGPLNEYLARIFLLDLKTLLQRGIRQDYLNIEEDELFLRGKLNLKQHVKYKGSKEHIFPIKHDVLGFDNAENRLLKTAVESILKNTSDTYNKKNALYFSHLMLSIPLSSQVNKDFNQWRTGRLLAHYQTIKPWCHLILNLKNPMALSGSDRGYSLLFPMEKIFEKYVGFKLKQVLNDPFSLHEQFKGKYLAKIESKNLFELKPDLVIKNNDEIEVILDVKWKLININMYNWNLNQGDLYQMYSYTHVYTEFRKDICLIYPYSEEFNKPIGPIQFLPQTKDGTSPKLWLIPFDILSPNPFSLALSFNTGLKSFVHKNQILI